MNEEDMIVPPGAEEAQDTSAEVTGELLDNDAVATGNEESAATDQAGGAAADDSADTDAGQDDAEDKTSDAVSAPPIQQEAQQLLQDPGEYQPKDYSFDVELADGTKVHIANPEDIDNIPNDAQFSSPKDLVLFQTAYHKLVTGLENDKLEFDRKKEAFNSQVESQKALDATVTTMVNEMNYLASKGKLPKVDPKYEDANWSDPEVAKQPGVAERIALLEYRSKENTERRKLGLSDMSVMEAHMQMQQEAAEKHAADVKQKQGELRKQKGAMVMGGSAGHIDTSPDDMIVGPGGSIRDIGL